MLPLLLTSSVLFVVSSVAISSPSPCGTCKVCFNSANSKCQDQGAHRPKTKAACEAKSHIWCGDAPTPSPPSPPPSPSPRPSPPPSPPSPGDFDVRTKWPQCSREVLSQGGCGSCWAFGSSEAISDRFCIMGEKVQLSPQSLVSCGCQGTCNGGAPGNALKYMASHGLQSCTSECTRGCEPYGSGHKPSGCASDPNNDRCHGCDQQCHDGTKATFYKVDASSIVHGKLDSDEKKIMSEIQAHGSVAGTLSVYSNWGSKWVKAHGPNAVYDSHEGSTHRGGHAIKIIGFGVSEGKKYWLIQNSWGPNFGDHGTIKMLRGGGAAKGIIGDNSFYATPVLKSTPDYKNTSLAELEIDPSLSVADDVVTGGWSDGDHTHPEWHSLARLVLASSNVVGEFDNLERVESQVTEGFNARFTLVTKEGTRAVISGAFGPEDELKTGPLVESVVELKSVVV